MITEFFMTTGAGIQAFFLGLFGTEDPPEWIATIATFLAELFARAAGLGAWIPWQLFGAVATTVLGLWGLFWIVKGIRWIWGLTPFSGGS